MVFHARNPGAFIDLAADIERVYGPGVVVDAHLPGVTGHPLCPGIACSDLSTINRAIGVLITRGYDPVEARVELRSGTADDTKSLPEVARQVLASTNAPPLSPA